MKPRLLAGGRIRRINDLPVIGWREWLAVPTLQIGQIKAKIDTGARTSSLHAFNIQTTTDRGMPHVSFVVHPEQRRRKPAIECIAEIFDQRKVTSSSGHQQDRYVIQVDIGLGGLTWPIELTLTNRDPMGFRMLLGREAVRRRFLIDSGRSFIAGRNHADGSMLSTRKVIKK